jgi:hypothetical protein
MAHLHDNPLKAYKVTLFSAEKGTVLDDQSVVFPGEPPYIINWKRRSYKIVSNSESADSLPKLLYAEVSACELTEIAVFFRD